VYVRLEIWYKQAEDVGEGREDRETLKRWFSGERGRKVVVDVRFLVVGE
jgi:hypothetical protein